MGNKNTYWKKVEEKFKSYETAKDKIEMYEYEIGRIDSKLKKMKGATYSDMPKSGLASNDQLTELISEKKEYEGLIEWEQEFVDKFDRALTKLEDKYKKEYAMFKIRHIEHENLEYTAAKFPWLSKNTMHARLQKMEKTFLDLLLYLKL